MYRSRGKRVSVALPVATSKAANSVVVAWRTQSWVASPAARAGSAR